MHYITTTAGLRDEIARRRDHADSIRKATDRFAIKHFGIERLTHEVQTHLALTHDSVPWGVLARQIASMCVEDITCFAASHLLGLKPITLTFYRDTYTSENHDKRSRVQIPWIWHSKKGNLVMERHMIASDPIARLERKIISGIQTSAGMLLPQFHELIRERAFAAQNPLCDVSSLHATLFWKAAKKPPSVFLNKHGYDHAVPSESVTKSECVRPPASWYYPLYLSWFLDGTMVLLETYENPEGAVPEAKKLFERTMSLIEDETGWYPLIVEVPPLSDEMLFCNRHLLESGKGVGTITDRIQGNEDNTVALCRHIAKAVIAYHP